MISVAWSCSFGEIAFAGSTSRRYSSFMASFAEVEKLALALSTSERATLAAKLIDSLPKSNSDDNDESGADRFKVIRQ